MLYKVGQKRDKGALEKRQANQEAEGEGVEGLEKKERREKKRVKVDEPQWVALGVKVKVLAMGWAEERSRAATGSTLGTGGRERSRKDHGQESERTWE